MKILTELLSNANVKTFFRQGSAHTAQLAAEEWMTRLLDANKVIAIDRRDRSFVEGYYEESTETISESSDEDGRSRKGVTKGNTYRPIIRSVTDENKVRQSPSDQLIMARRIVMTLGTGWMVQCRGAHATTKPQYVPMLEEKWVFRKKKRERVEVAMSSIIAANPQIYQKPNLGSAMTSHQGRGGAGEKRKRGSA